MATEGLVRKKRIQAGHRGSATRTLSKVNELLEVETADSGNRSQLAKFKLNLVEKLETLKQLDAEILELTEEET